MGAGLRAMRLEARRGRLSPAEQRQISHLSPHLSTEEVADIFKVTKQTVRVYRRKAPKMQQPTEFTDGAASTLAQRVGFAAPDPAIKSLIAAYEDGKRAFARWGPGARCHYKGEHEQAWKMGFDSK